MHNHENKIAKYEDIEKQAISFTRSGEIEKAIQYYNQAIGIDTGQVNAYYQVALLYHKQNNIEEAINNFRKASELNPTDASIFNNLGVLYYLKEKIKEAEIYFKKAIEIDPEYPEGLYGLGNVYLKQERIYDAIIVFKKCLQVNPSLANARLKIEECYKKINLESVKRKYKKILIVMDEGIGNMVMLTPAIKAIKERLPDSKITILGKEPSIEVVYGWDLIDKVLTEPDNEQYDIGFLTIWSRNYSVRYKEQIYSQCRAVYKIEFNDVDVHEVQHHLKIAAFFGYEGDAPEPFCMTKEIDIELPSNKRIIALSDTTLNNDVWEKKRWRYYRLLAEKLIKRDYSVLLIGGRNEAKRFNKEDWPAEVIDCLGKFDIQETAGLLKKCNAFIGNDSGPAHIAAALNIPTYVLFGPTRISKNRPYGSQVHIITKHLPCSPCQYTDKWSECKDWQCMSQILVEDVLQAIDEHELIQKGRKDPASTAMITQNSQKILIVGVLDVPSSTNVFMKKSFEKLGLIVDAYNYRTRMRELGSHQAMWNDFYEFLKGKRYKLIIFSKVNDLSPDLITHARQYGKTWYWFMDNLGIARAIHADEYVKRADFASATSQEVSDWFKEFNPNVFQILEGFDPDTYFYENLPKVYDLLFVGNATDKRVNDIKHLRNSHTITIFGNGWPDDFCARSPVYNEELRKVICQSRIILNLVHSNIFSDRVILTAASGGFVLSQACPDLERHFQRKKHMDWFSTEDEAHQLIHYYLKHEDERERIAQSGMQYVRQKYSWESVCQEILQKTEKFQQKDKVQICESAAERILFVSWHGLGDNVMLTPALRKYKQLHPDSYIAIAGLERFGKTLVQLLSGLPFINEVIPCLPDAWNDFADYKTGVSAVIQRAQAVAKEKGFPRVVVLPTQRKTGYKLHKIFRFADEVGVEFEYMEDLQTELAVNKDAEKRVEEFTKEYRKPILVLHTKAGNQIKTLLSESVERVINNMYQEHIIFEFGQCSTSRSILVQENDMEFSKALIKRADMVIAIDSVVMHIAGAFRRPLMAIFTVTPVHQAVPLTYKVTVCAVDNEKTLLNQWSKFQEEIEDIYKTQNIPLIPQFKQYRDVQYAVEKGIHLNVADYGPDAEKFLQIIVQQLPELQKLPSYRGKCLVLDIGCNTGYNTKMLAEKYGDAIGIDINNTLIENARTHNWPKCYLMDMHHLAFKSKQFDLIFAKDVLEHSYDPDKTLSECFRTLLPGGFLTAFIPMDGKGSCSIGLTPGNLSHYWKTNLFDCKKRIEQAGFENIFIYHHSHKEIVGRERFLGDEIIIVVAQKPYIHKYKKFYLSEYRETNTHPKNATICLQTPGNKGIAATVQKDTISQRQKNLILLPKKYYDPDAYWAIFLTLKCTSDCPYCIQRIDKDNFKKAMHGYTMLSGDRWISLLNELYHPEGRHLAIIGGEPTIHPDFIQIINGFKGYKITVTTNLKSPFFQDMEKSVRLLKPHYPVRFNTSFHPELSSSDEFCNRILHMKRAGLWVDQIAMVDHPGSQFDNYRAAFLQYGIRLTAQSFLGNWNGKIYPNPYDATVKNDLREHGITDMTRYKNGFSAQIRQSILCSTKRFLIAPDGAVYNCHYRLYSRSKNHCGQLTNSSIILPEDFFHCEDYGFCNPCDYPHVVFKTIEQPNKINGVLSRNM